MRILSCYSNKGGVGKTATSVNLAYAFAQGSARVLLCDLDPQGAASFYFRVKPSKKLEGPKFFKDVERFTKSIRGSDFENLDLLPANMSFRDFDVFLARMRNRRSRLKKALKSVGGEYDVVILDCPPNISTLSENVFHASDQIVVPVIPTTLSERTFEQLISFFSERTGLKKRKILPFFSMVQGQKSLHKSTMTRMRKAHKNMFLSESVPFSTDVERMGVHRSPVVTFAPNRQAAKAYQEIWRELNVRK